MLFRSSIVLAGSSYFRPNTDNTINLGGASNRWKEIFAGNATINTSDGREKQQIRSLTDAEHAVAVSIKGLLRAFKFNDSVTEKGDSARIHFGVIAQDVKAAFEAQGLVAEKYGLFCYDEWTEESELLDENGKVVRSYRPAGVLHRTWLGSDLQLNNLLRVAQVSGAGGRVMGADKKVCGAAHLLARNLYRFRIQLIDTNPVRRLSLDRDKQEPHVFDTGNHLKCARVVGCL